jgi:IPT/TIG domain
VSATGRQSEFIYDPPPSITSLSPNYGPEAGGTKVTITGAHLSGGTEVSFGAVPAASVEDTSENLITAVAPPGTSTVDVVVTTYDGGHSTHSEADRFSYLAPPTIKRVTPKKGPAAGGTTVTITGKNLLDVSTVSFGSTSATSFTANSPTSLTAVAPPHATGVVDVTVVTGGGASRTVSKDHFKYGR